jgi:hypothetical protein
MDDGKRGKVAPFVPNDEAEGLPRHSPDVLPARRRDCAFVTFPPIN